MRRSNHLHVLLALATCVVAQTACPVSVATSVAAPSVAPGFEARLIATGLNRPRGIKLDYNGHLLVLESGSGIVALTLEDHGGTCLSENSRTAVVNDTSLNHGITVSHDGKTLYASSSEAVFSYPYDEVSGKVTGPSSTIVNGMAGSDHTTRTLLLSKKQEGTLIVTRGSTSNLDAESADITSGHSQVKAYDLTSFTGTSYDFNSDGKLLGWGLRNEVGIDEEPLEGGLYSVENSADELTRNNVDIHEDNPAERMNFLGWLTPPAGTAQSPNQGSNFGYPHCFAAWDASTIPEFDGSTGELFAIGDVDSTDDAACQEKYTAPRLAFQAHMAPLDIKFWEAGNEAWITFHGSWDRTQPSGYKVGIVQFNGGGPVAEASSTSALIDVVSNQDDSKCPDGCFRPVAMAWDSQGRIYFSSDSTGEIYVVHGTDSSPGTFPVSSPNTGADATNPATASRNTNSSTSTTGASQENGSSPGSVAWPMSRSIVCLLIIILTSL